MKVRKKPVVVEAWLPYTDEPMPNWYEEGLINHTIMERCDGSGIDIKTLEGIMTASNGDYIVRGVNGEFYPCKPDIFEKTYDVVNDDECVPLKHYKALKQWVDSNLFCEYDDPVWNPEAFKAIHYILDDYKLRINCQLTAKETVNDVHL